MNAMNETAPPCTRWRDKQPLVVAVWLLIQLIALGISAVGIPLANRWIDPPAAWAWQQMVVTQVIVISLLYHWLLRTVEMTLSTIAISIFFNIIAIIMSARPVETLLAPIAAAALWIAAMHPLAQIRHPGTAMLIRTLVPLWVIGGVVLGYLAADYGERQTFPMYSPIVWVIAAEDSPKTMLTAFVGGIVVACVLRISTSHQSERK